MDDSAASYANDAHEARTNQARRARHHGAAPHDHPAWEAVVEWQVPPSIQTGTLRTPPASDS